MTSRTRGESLDLVNGGSELKRTLARILEAKGEIIPYSDDPALASLCTCLGLEFELGNRHFDRLSPFFGVEPAEGENPWVREIFSTDSEFGLELRRKDGLPLQVRHSDFVHLLDRESLDAEGNLTRLVFYPARIAQNFRERGFELVVVRDWLLSSCLDVDKRFAFSYLFANEWEIRNNVARTQISLMTNRQLAFSGTHDVADHLLGSDITRFLGTEALCRETKRRLDGIFAEPAGVSRLVLSYFIGILLDDMAQPRWYGSERHSVLLRQSLESLGTLGASDGGEITLPGCFHDLVQALRNPNETVGSLQIRLGTLVSHLETASRLGPKSLKLLTQEAVVLSAP